MGANDGKLVYGSSGSLLHGSGGMPLYYADTVISFTMTVTISWSGSGKDLDVCAFFSHASEQKIGWNYVSQLDTGKTGEHVNTISDGRFTATWGGDNVDGGPETITIQYTGTKGYLVGKRFEVHGNWYNRGEGSFASPWAYVRLQPNGATGINNWIVTNKSFTPANRRHQAAGASDPGVAFTFGSYGNGTTPSNI